MPRPGHRNFTIGHELGHYHIDGHTESMFGGGVKQVLSQGGHFRNRRDPHEREADWFASELLMPERWTGPLVRTLPATLETLDKLATTFNVSLCCAAVRYAELTDEAVAVIVSRDRQIEWVAFSARVQEHPWSRKAWKRDFVPPSTGTDRLARASGRIRAGDSEVDSSLLCTWFDGAPEMVTAEEEAVGLGTYCRVVTLLSVPRLPTPEEIEEDLHEQNWRERDWRDTLRGYSLD